MHQQGECQADGQSLGATTTTRWQPAANTNPFSMIKRSAPESLLLEIYRELKDSFAKVPSTNNRSLGMYEDRLQTFEHWRGPRNLVFDLAKDGFSAVLHHDNATECYHCGTRVYHWNAYDNPTMDHLVWSKKHHGAPCPIACLRLLTTHGAE